MSVDEIELPSLSPARRAEFQGFARSELRRLLRSDGDSATLQAIDRIGRSEIEAASALTARLGIESEGRAEALLGEMDRVVSAVQQPVRRRNVFGFGAEPPPIERRLRDAEPVLARLLGELATERDRMVQAGLSGQRLEGGLAEAEAALEQIGHLLLFLRQGAEAAARELVRDQPSRARFVELDVTARLLERSRDVNTQLAVIRQARLSLGVLLASRQSLIRAIDRTRQIMLSALRTAVAAVAALEGGARHSAAAAALDEATTRSSVESSVHEMRNALGAR